jgi:hypothetical protein
MGEIASFQYTSMTSSGMRITCWAKARKDRLSVPTNHYLYIAADQPALIVWLPDAVGAASTNSREIIKHTYLNEIQ